MAVSDRCHCLRDICHLFKQVPDQPAYIGIALIMAGVIIINLFSKMETH